MSDLNESTCNPKTWHSHLSVLIASQSTVHTLANGHPTRRPCVYAGTKVRILQVWETFFLVSPFLSVLVPCERVIPLRVRDGGCGPRYAYTRADGPRTV